jgi:hypothetical protein
MLLLHQVAKEQGILWCWNGIPHTLVFKEMRFEVVDWICLAQDKV